MRIVSDRILWLKKHRGSEAYRLKLPSHTRFALGLQNGTSTFLVPSSQGTSIVVSEISPLSWGDLWRLRVKLTDSPGASLKLFEVLRAGGVNIVKQEVTTISSSPMAAIELEMLLDLRNYSSEIDGDTRTRNSTESPEFTPSHLLHQILEGVGEDTVRGTAGTATNDWRIQCQRAKFFFENKDFIPRFERSLVSGSELLIPKSLITERIHWNRDLEGEIPCLAIADTEEGFLKLDLLQPGRLVMILDIRHQDRLGAFQSLLDYLISHRLDVKSTLLRTTSLNSKDVLITVSAEIGSGLDILELLRSLPTVGFVEDLKIVDSYGIIPSVRSELRGEGLLREASEGIVEDRVTADTGSAKREARHSYDVALSFAGEDRAHAERLAGLLTDQGLRVFYDRYERSGLWGKDLYQHLQKVYKDDAEYCVIFVSEHYARKLWARHELKNAQVRAFMEAREYILPIRLDDTEVAGIHNTLAYIDLREVSIEEIAEDLLEKINEK